jgi:YD repeat-containing protein
MKHILYLVVLATLPALAAVTYSYDAAGRLSKVDYGNGTVLNYTYDKAGNLLSRVVAANGAPSVISASPTSGNTAARSFTFTFSHSSGFASLSVVNILINNFLDGRHACYLAYVVASTTLVLVDDAGDAGGPFAGMVTLGNPATTIQNSQCAVNLTSATGSGNNLTLVLNIAFKTAYGGNKIQYLAARDASGGNSDWQALGVWQAPPAPSGQITVVSLTPAWSAAPSGTAQTLAAVLADTKGSGDFGVINVIVNKFLDGRQACYLAYIASINTLVLIDDAGDAGGPFAGSLVMNGSPGTIQNSQCSISGTGTSAVSSGNTLTLTLNITFKAAFAGNRIVWVAGRDTNSGNNTDWQAMGTESVQ